MSIKKFVCLLFTLLSICPLTAQQQNSVGIISSSAIEDVDSTFVYKFEKPNDVRLIYGTQGSSLEYGSKNETNPSVPTSIFNNVNDFVGIGLTYKILDADITFSLPKTRLLEEDRENLNQFKFSLSYTGRKFTIRGLISDTKGMVSADPMDRFQSNADVHQFRISAQFTYIFNHQKYSYRAAMFQNELQRKTAGSFLLRLEPFYRGLGAGSGLVPSSYDNVQTYGDQVGLEYLKAPGFLVMPGYGVTITPFDEKFYVAPLIFGGPGLAFNFYQGNLGDFTYTNFEWAAVAALNVGYNGVRTYLNLNITGDINYTPLNPTYFTSSNLKISLTFGYRFVDLEKFIPRSFL